MSAGGTLDGTFFSVGGISAGATTIGATLESQSVSTTGLVTSTHLGFAPGTIANSTSSSPFGLAPTTSPTQSAPTTAPPSQ